MLIALAERQVLIEPNGKLPPPRNTKRWPWMGKPGEVVWDGTEGEGEVKEIAVAMEDLAVRDKASCTVA